jgi:hypothetical protein
MKCRQLSFYAEPEAAEHAKTVISEQVIPKYIGISHFIGFVVLETDPSPGHPDADTRRELTVLSFWEDGLEGSESAAQEFVSEVNRVARTNPVRKSFNLLQAMWRDGAGDELATFP